MILGLDLATTKTGYAILNNDKSLLCHGAIRTLSKEPLDRITEIYLFLEDILTQYDIHVIAVEDVPLTQRNNLKVGKDLCILQGAICALSIRYNKQFILYSPTSWRSIVGTYDGTREGTKRAIQKEKAVHMVNDLYNLEFEYYENETKTKITNDDEAEAILIALAYIEEQERSA